MIFTLKERLNFELSAVLNLNYSVQLDEADSAQTVAPFAQNFCPWWVPSKDLCPEVDLNPEYQPWHRLGY